MVAGEPVPVADLDGQAERGKRGDAAPALEPAHGARPAWLSGHLEDGRVEAVAAGGDGQFGVEGFVKGDLQARLVEALVS